MDPATLIQDHAPIAVVAVLLSAAIWQGMHLLRLYVQKQLNGRLEMPRRAAVCAWSPEKAKEWADVVEHIRLIHESQTAQAKMIAHGDFTCAFKGRDEVRDMTELLREIRAGIERLNTNLERHM